MGRKSRKKKERLSQGDIIYLTQPSLCMPTGYYKVNSTDYGMFNYTVGEILGGCSLSVLGKYKKIDPSSIRIDWKKEEIKFQDSFAQVQNDTNNWEELPLDIEDFGMFETKIRKLRVQ